METTDSVSLIFLIYAAQAEATCSFVISPLSQEKTLSALVGFHFLFTAKCLDSRDNNLQHAPHEETLIILCEMI